MNPNALVIAASDPSGGAGIEADLKVLAAHRVNGLTAITAITVQDSRGLQAVHPVELKLFKKILDLHLHDQKIHAVKIGALADSGHIKAVRDFLAKLKPLPPVVLDPVMRASSGKKLLAEKNAAARLKDLIPFCALITPNLGEAGMLAAIKVNDLAAMKEAARRLHELGARAVLVKGGHLRRGSADLLFNGEEFFAWKNRLKPREFHGTGCALASAIAANLARGAPLPEAVERARAYLTRCMKNARKGQARAWLLEMSGSEQSL